MSLTSSLLVVAFKCYEREVALGNPKFCYFVLLGLLSDLEQLVFALDSSWRVVVSLRQSSSVLGTDSSLAHLLDDCKGVSRALILTCQCTYNSDTRGLQPGPPARCVFHIQVATATSCKSHNYTALCIDYSRYF